MHIKIIELQIIKEEVVVPPWLSSFQVRLR